MKWRNKMIQAEIYVCKYQEDNLLWEVFINGDAVAGGSFLLEKIEDLGIRTADYISCLGIDFGEYQVINKKRFDWSESLNAREFSRFNFNLLNRLLHPANDEVKIA